MAVALRHSCQNHDDYSLAKEQLLEFKNVWEKRYTKDAGERRHQNQARPDHRFQSEELALKTAYFNYKRFMDLWVDDDGEKPIFSKTWDELGNLAKEIKNVEKAYVNNKAQHIIERVKRQVYSNQCCLFIFSKYAHDNELVNMKIDDAQGKLVYKNLRRLKDETSNFRPSYFINFLLAFSAWHFDTETEITWQKALEETEIALRCYQIPYEKNKYDHFKGILTAHGEKFGWLKSDTTKQ
jgi:hypothetical protein